MNFTPFGSFTQTIPGTAMHQFTAAKFPPPGGQVLGVISTGEGGVHYLRPVDNGFNNQQGPQIITLPITVSGKPGDETQPTQTVQIQVVNPNAPTLNPNSSNNNTPKYVMPIQLQGFPQGAATILTLAYNQAAPGEQLQLQLQPQIQITTNESEQIEANNNSVQTEESLTVDDKSQESNVEEFPVALVANHMIFKNSADIETKSTQTQNDKNKTIKEDLSEEDDVNADDNETEQSEFLNTSLTSMPSAWQSVATPGSAVADYLSRIPANTLPLSLHHFLKFSTDTIKREQGIASSPLSVDLNETSQNGIEDPIELEIDINGKTRKKKRTVKKKPPRPKKPRPGQVHIATALDGTTLFCCPECHMAYPEKELLEQHLVGHKIERRFICDICGAGLKRKEHLERHKLGHNPERPFVCHICMKGFKRKEHLNLHAVIHSGEKTEICNECGKGFYRKDHLRKHAKSHATKKYKEELQLQQQAAQAQAQAIVEAQQLAQHAQISIPIPNMPGISVIPINRGSNNEDNQNAVITIKTEIEDNDLPNLTSQEPEPQLTITSSSSN